MSDTIELIKSGARVILKRAKTTLSKAGRAIAEEAEQAIEEKSAAYLKCGVELVQAKHEGNDDDAFSIGLAMKTLLSEIHGEANYVGLAAAIEIEKTIDNVITDILDLILSVLG